MSTEKSKFFIRYCVLVLILGIFASGFYNTFVLDFNIKQSSFENDPFNEHKNLRKKQLKKSAHIRTKYKPRKRIRIAERNTAGSAGTSPAAAATITDELELTLFEAYNGKKYGKVLKGDEVRGSLSTRDGIIESLEVSFPDQDFAISFSQMKGSVFTYNQDGRNLSGLIYKSNNQNYLISFVNGPLQGTKLKFRKEEDVYAISKTKIEDTEKLGEEDEEDFIEEEREIASEEAFEEEFIEEEKEIASEEAFEKDLTEET